MIESSGDLTLTPEAFEDEVGVHPAFDQLDGDGLIELTVDSRSSIDNTHAATADFFVESIRTDSTADHCIGGNVLKLSH